MSSGLVLVVGASSAQATQPDPEHKVWICHATESDTNPYVVIDVDVASKKYQGHLAHKETPNKQWKSAGSWNGEAHALGDDKPDLIEGLDFEGYPAFCEKPVPPSEDPSPTEPPTEDPKVTAQDPVVEQSDACGVEGTYFIPKIQGVHYLLDGHPIAHGEYDGPASGVVTAEASGQAVLSNPAFSYALEVPPAEVCPSQEPTSSEPTPAETPSGSGSASVPGASAPGTVAGSQGVAPGAASTEPSCDAQCGEVLGQEETKGGQSSQEPERAPVVLGSQAAVPTAVDAGLGSTPATGADTTTPLGRTLTAGGIAMLLAAGWVLVGRRERGARQA